MIVMLSIIHPDIVPLPIAARTGIVIAAPETELTGGALALTALAECSFKPVHFVTSSAC
jgi:hypothetical protein